MWIDSHCHLDAAEFDADRAGVAEEARTAGVSGIVIPAVARGNFSVVAELARGTPGGAYALGIHPLYIDAAREDDLAALRAAVAAAVDDPRFVGIGEIGLDYFVPGLDPVRQEFFYVEQLKIAKEFDLPVILHVRRSQDALLKQLRRIRVRGIAHAFNGSRQQAGAFVELGFKLGFGGAMTFEPALRIRALARELPLEALVLETDAPDIAPSWLGTPGERKRNTPGQLPRIGAELAALRGIEVDAAALATSRNVREALPRLQP
ncbi:MAG: TatD family hydrolase [Candidatus Protistobacter heckmanni]|nr:TatD family hydrolase [Candidatus Protistobacter heckmanni]